MPTNDNPKKSGKVLTKMVDPEDTKRNPFAPDQQGISSLPKAGVSGVGPSNSLLTTNGGRGGTSHPASDNADLGATPNLKKKAG